MEGTNNRDFNRIMVIIRIIFCNIKYPAHETSAGNYPVITPYILTCSNVITTGVLSADYCSARYRFEEWLLAHCYSHKPWHFRYIGPKSLLSAIVFSSLRNQFSQTHKLAHIHALKMYKNCCKFIYILMYLNVFILVGHEKGAVFSRKQPQAIWRCFVP